jgi:hypothetical protein
MIGDGVSRASGTLRHTALEVTTIFWDIQALRAIPSIEVGINELVMFLRPGNPQQEIFVDLGIIKLQEAFVPVFDFDKILQRIVNLLRGA